MKLRGEAGQFTVEAVLVLTILFSTVFAATQMLREQQVLSKMVEGPWQFMAGMIENAHWSPPQIGRAKHPNHASRHGSPEGDRP
jgi:hypothetical protein